MRLYKHLSLSLLLCAGASFTAHAQDSVGVNAAVKGNVTIASQGQEAAQAIVKAPVFLGDDINSRKVSSLQVLLKDETVFTVGPECALTIDEFVYDPSKNTNSLSAKVSKGMFRFMSGNISKSGPSAVSIDTPVASLGVRGTIVEGLVGADAIALATSIGMMSPGQSADVNGASLFVLRGPGSRKRGKNTRGEIQVTSGGGQVTLRQAGQVVFVPSRSAAPIGPIDLPASAFEAFNEQLRTKPTSGPDFRPFDVDLFVTPPGRVVRQEDPFDSVFEPVDMDWPNEDIFSNPCGVPICP